jgi:hypothetical protein
MTEVRESVSLVEVEIDSFQGHTTAGEISAQVFNRAIFMLRDNDPRLARPHRFFCGIQQVSSSAMSWLRRK